MSVYNVYMYVFMYICMYVCMHALVYVDVHMYWFLHKLDTNLYSNNKKYDNVK